MGASSSSHVIVGTTFNRKQDMYAIALVPLFERYFPSADSPHFRALHAAYQDATTFGGEVKRGLDEYYHEVVTLAEEAVAAGGRPPYPVAVLSFTWSATQPPSNWTVIGYFGCRKFHPASKEHTLGIFLKKEGSQRAIPVVQLATRLFAHTSKAPRAWPSSIGFTTRHDNARVKRLLKCVFLRYPDLQQLCSVRPGAPVQKPSDRVSFAVAPSAPSPTLSAAKDEKDLSTPVVADAESVCIAQACEAVGSEACWQWQPNPNQLVDAHLYALAEMFGLRCENVLCTKFYFDDIKGAWQCPASLEAGSFWDANPSENPCPS